MFSRTMTMFTRFPGIPGTLDTGRTFPYRSSALRSATMGEEYPATL